MSLFSGKPKCLSPLSRSISQPWLEWNPTKTSVKSMIKKAFAVSLNPYINSFTNEFKTDICFVPVTIR